MDGHESPEIGQVWELSFWEILQPGLLIHIVDDGVTNPCFRVLSLLTGNVEIADLARWTEPHLKHLVGQRLM